MLLLLLASGSLKASAQEKKALSLQECIDYAIKHSAAAKNARLDIELQKAQNAEVTGSALPQISGEGQYTRFIDVQQTFLPSTFLNPAAPFEWIPFAFSPKQSTIGSVKASQLLFNGSLFVALQARNTLLQLAQQQADMKVEDLRYNIQKAYAGLVIAQKQFALMQSSLELTRNTRNESKIMYSNGVIEKLEVDRLEVQLSNLEADSISLHNMILVSEQMLKYTIGMDLNTPIELSDAAVFEQTDHAKALLMREEGYENRLSYLVSMTSVRLLEYDLKRYRFEGMPTLSAFGNAGYNRAGDKLTDLTSKPYPGFSMVGLNLNVPIFDGMQRRNRVKTAKLKLEKAENDLDNLKLGIDFQTKSARTTLTNALQTIEGRKRTMDLANTVLDLAKKKYKAGVGSNQDVVLAQADYLNAQNNYFSALQNVVNAQADLQKALGLLK